MALYESYLDEDIDDESYFDEGLGEDYDEDFDEADTTHDHRTRQRRRRQAQARNRHRGHRGHHHPHRGHPGQHKQPVTPGGVRKAFTNVSDDVDHLKGKIKETEDSQSTAMGIEVLGQAVFAPKLIFDPSGKNVIGIKDNLLPLMATKVVGNMVAGRKVNFKKMLPWLIGAFILSPQSFNDLGFGGIKPATTPGDGETPEGGTTPPPAQQQNNNLLGVPPGILAIGGLVAIALMNDKK